MPVFPLLCLFAVCGLGALIERRPRLGWAAAAVVVGVAMAWTLVLAGRYVGPQPQDVASRWIARHVPDDARLWVAGSGLYFSPDLVMKEALQAENVGLYERKTHWQIDPGNFDGLLRIERGRAWDPEFVVLTLWQPVGEVDKAWLREPGYEVVASFPGKVHLFGRRTPVPLDLYDVDTWVLRRAAPSHAAP